MQEKLTNSTPYYFFKEIINFKIDQVYQKDSIIMVRN